MHRIRIAEKTDWDQFFTLAGAEGWRIPDIERQLFAGPWQHCARVMEVDRAFCGLVTSVAHERSGWIGNLIVPRQLRGHGYGSRLFMAALSVLQAQGMRSLWLTASQLGLPIYEKSGFTRVDTIERWVSGSRSSGGAARLAAPAAKELLCACDLAAWGEARTPLLESLLELGQAFAVEGSVALLQQEPGLQIIGPWYSRSCCPHANRQLLQQILTAADPCIEIVVDILSSSPLRSLLAAAGFVCSGHNALMVQGDAGDIDSGMMVSLASLGSIG
ncbi:MAG: GNAT family N-acetyltransferase [Desulfuromonadales bacterium]